MMIHSDIGMINFYMKDLKTALYYFNKTFEVAGYVFTENHPHFVVVRTNIGSVYQHMKDNMKKALDRGIKL